MAHGKAQPVGFEDSLSKLESIVSQLESGDLPLERALEIFEEGVGLARLCQSHLAEAERKVEMLLRERGELKTVPFDPSADLTESPTSPRAVSTTVPKAATPASVPTIDFDDDIPF
ncbi:MAG: exodeoxyribonuclease VII small subunit [Acidobacteria bacterium]|nr:exodeoxyribonuclease VII small subunit [Acidobacteriota bacterium]